MTQSASPEDRGEAPLPATWSSLWREVESADVISLHEARDLESIIERRNRSALRAAQRSAISSHDPSAS